MEFSEGTDVAVKENFVEIGYIELPDDDPVQCGSEFCVICNELAMEQQPPSLAHVYCGQTAGWIKMAFGMEVGLGPGHTVTWETSSPIRGIAVLPIFGPCLLWPNGCMDQNATWYGGRPQHR